MIGQGFSNSSAYRLKPAWLECPGALFAPSWFVRLRARWQRLALDQALADGADPASSPLLAARAAQLVRRPARVRLAAALERVALGADAPSGLLRTAPRRGAVAANRARLIELAATLRRGGPLYARGIAILELVLIDGTGPAYTDARGEGLARQLELAGASLGG
jgi:hypothetical protein